MTLCACGCGVVPNPGRRFIHGHNTRLRPSQVWLFNGRRWYVRARDGSHVLWYRIVARDTLGRELLPGEVVHHLNGDPTDDRPENLEVLASQGEHSRLHHAEGYYDLSSFYEGRQRANDRRNRKISAPCAVCGVTVTRSPALMRRERVYCSPTCVNRGRKLGLVRSRWDVLARQVAEDAP